MGKNNMGYDWKSGRQFGQFLENVTIGNLLENIWKKKEDLPDDMVN
jgi:hypothetical protein